MHNCKSCEHKELRYCPACQKVYCLECGMEWSESAAWPYSNTYPMNSYTADAATYTEGGSWIDN